MMGNDGDDTRSFEPSFPFYIVCADGSPMTGSDGDIVFVMVCATRELGELVADQFHAVDCHRKMGLQPIVDGAEFLKVAARLVDQGVTHMSWNATGQSTTINVVGLSDFAN